MKKLNEEIGRNFHTDDTDPIPFDYDNNIAVSTNATSDGQYTVKIKVKSAPELSQAARSFSDEVEAELYARNQVMTIKTALENQTEIREYISLFLRNVL